MIAVDREGKCHDDILDRCPKRYAFREHTPVLSSSFFFFYCTARPVLKTSFMVVGHLVVARHSDHAAK